MPAVSVAVSFMAELPVGSALLPRAPLQAEVREQDRRHQERHHRGRQRRALAERAARDRALERERRHQVRRVERAAARQHISAHVQPLCKSATY